MNRKYTLYDAQELYDEEVLRAKIKAQEGEDGVITDNITKSELIESYLPRKVYKQVPSDVTFQASGIETDTITFVVITPKKCYQFTADYYDVLQSENNDDVDRLVTGGECAEFVDKFLKSLSK